MLFAITVLWSLKFIIQLLNKSFQLKIRDWGDTIQLIMIITYTDALLFKVKRKKIFKVFSFLSFFWLYLKIESSIHVGFET